MVTRFLPGATTVARGEPDGTLTVYDHDTSQIHWSQQVHRGSITALEWSPDGAWLASGGGDGLVYLFQTTSGLCSCSFEHGRAVQRLEWSPDSRQLCITSGHRIHVLRITPFNDTSRS
jgi:WD40 repeat protein